MPAKKTETPLHVVAIKLLRPYLTYVAFTVYIIASTVGLFIGLVNFELWFSQIGTMVSMMISYYFAERATLKDPSKGNDFSN